MKTIITLVLVVVCSFATFAASSPFIAIEKTNEWPAVAEVAILQSANGLEISWKANAEERDIIYIIEKSSSGKQYTQVAVVLAGFEENGSFSYKFRHKQAGAVAQYRILQVKPDGTARVVGRSAAQ